MGIAESLSFTEDVFMEGKVTEVTDVDAGDESKPRKSLAHVKKGNLPVDILMETPQTMSTARCKKI